MSLSRSMAALDLTRRFTPVASFVALLAVCLLSGCVDHSFGRPYSGTTSLLKTGARPPWYCYGGAPTTSSAVVERVGYTTAFTCVVVANAVGETLILPVDLFSTPSEGPASPAQLSCGPEPPY